MAGERARQPGPAGPDAGLEALEIGPRQIAARQGGADRPGLAHLRKEGCQAVERVLGQLAVGGDLAAEGRQQRGFLLVAIQLEHVVAGHGRGVGRVVVIERSDAGEARQDVGARQLRLEVAIEDAEQIGDLGLVGGNLLRRTVIGDVGGADQGQIALIGIDEDQALVGVLEDIGVLPLPELAGDDVAALDQADMALAGHTLDLAEHPLDPGAGGVDQRARLDHLLAALGMGQLDPPQPVDPAGASERGPGQDAGAALGGIERREHDQAGVVDPAVGIFEGAPEGRPDRRALQIAPQIERAGAGQLLPAAQMVVQPQAQADQPDRALLRAVRQDHAHRPDDMRGGLEQHLALDQRLAHQPELVVLQVAQAAVDILAAARGGAFREVVLLAQQHAQAAAGGIARDARPVDAAADDHEIVEGVLAVGRHGFLPCG